MPKNNSLKRVNLPMKMKFNEKQKTKFINNLDAINVELVDYPSVERLMSYLPGFVEATWSESYNSNDKMSRKDKVKILNNVFRRKTLPTALETIGLTFRISGISLQEVTHLIRYRKGSFSADCSGDKWWTEKDGLIPWSIENSTGKLSDDNEIMVFGTSKNGVSTSYEAINKSNFKRRYEKIVEMSKELYCDMIDSKEISIMDARYILPRCLSTYYYMRINLGDAIHFINQRIDKQIQPETDNIIAYQMYLRILEAYPFANGLINIHSPSMFYIKMARTGKATNLYFPDKDSDSFEWNENDFIYQCERSEMNGTDKVEENKFLNIQKEVEEKIKKLEKENEKKIKKLEK